MTTTKRGTFLKKTPQTILSWWNHFWNTIAHFFVTLRTRTLQNKNLTHIWKKLIPTNLAVKLANTSKKKRSVSKFFRLYLNNNWQHCPRLVCISPSVQVFSSLRRPEKQSWNQQGHQRPRYLRGSTNVTLEKSITAVNRVEHQKSVNVEKNMERDKWFSEAIKEQFHQRLRSNLENAKRKEVHLICIEKTHQLVIKNLRA